MSEHTIAATLMRGGTSKGVFVDAADLPPPGERRDHFILALLGSPDPMQINGLGGTYSSTSKLMAVSASDHQDCDVDYLFAQVGVEQPVVDYQGNCGNLTTAVAPFALDEGMVGGAGAQATVTLRNLNTGVRVRSTVPLHDGRAAVEGDTSVAGVPGTGPAIVTDYLDPGGSVLGSVLPTGKAQELIELPDGSAIEASIIDVTSPHAFVRQADVDLDDLARLEAIRAACGEAVGLDSLAVPRLVIVDPPADAAADIECRATSMQRVHHAMPMTGALCTAAAAGLDGTIPNETASGPDVAPGKLRLRHPKGVVELRAEVIGSEVRSVGVTRTARRLFRGHAFVVIP
ncbi:MAG: PrpF domain-containing protein [Acidimicrobiales bacterium]